MSISNPGPTTERKIWHLSFGDGLCLTWRLLPCVHTQHSPLQLEIAPLCSQTARTLFILLLMDPQVGFRDLATEMALQNPSCASVSAMRRSGVPWLRRSATAGSYGRAVSRYLRPPPILISVLAVYTPASKDSFLSLSPPAFLSFVFLMTAVLTGVR